MLSGLVQLFVISVAKICLSPKLKMKFLNYLTKFEELMKKLQIYTILNKLNDRTNFLNFSLNNFKFLKILFHKNVYVAYKI